MSNTDNPTTPTRGVTYAQVAAAADKLAGNGSNPSIRAMVRTPAFGRCVRSWARAVRARFTST